MKKIFLWLLMIFPVVLAGCSCSTKFDINTYETAVKNYNNSTGFEYKLIVTTRINGENSYTRKESLNKYILTTTGEVYDFSSEMRSYTIITSSHGVDGDPQLNYTYYRYYVGDEGKFYTKEKVGNTMDNKHVDTISYEEKYQDLNSEYNKNNLVPTFTKDQLNNFSISAIKEQKGYSVATFTSVAPSFITNEDVMVQYKVKMDKSFYFSTIEFTVVEEHKTTTYEYSFSNYNSQVYINFPVDLNTY